MGQEKRKLEAEAALGGEDAPAEGAKKGPTAAAQGAVDTAAAPSPSAGEPTRPSFAPHPEAGPVHFAELWYFVDNHGGEQGPHSAAAMRAWFEAGYFPPSCKVAASYYGEVPERFWPIGELWANPSAEAFIIVVTREVEVPPDVRPEFEPSDVFTGAKEGYCFKVDLYGLGYYLDQPPEVDPRCTWQELEKDKEEREATRRRLNAAVHFSGEGPS